MKNHKVTVTYMKKLAALLCLIAISASSFSKDLMNDNLLRFLYFDDLKVWVSGGKSYFNWSTVTDKNKLLSNSIYAPQVVYHDFDSNIYAASNKYNMVPLQLNGVVQSVKANRNGEPLVTFSAGFSDQFEASGFDVEDAAKLNRGQQFRFVCYQFNYDGFTLSSPNCTTLNKYYELITLEIYNNINVKEFEEIADNASKTEKIRETFNNVKTHEKFRKFNEECSQASVDDVNCRNKLDSIFSELTTSKVI